mmetsp:Transcript_20713/g.31746  ORF Transcript_20713/g.31746 Transcript_20713/m.31746 type:complete len:232 (+) Transcript_20713:5628-6323(+)
MDLVFIDHLVVTELVSQAFEHQLLVVAHVVFIHVDVLLGRADVGQHRGPALVFNWIRVLVLFASVPVEAGSRDLEVPGVLSLALQTQLGFEGELLDFVIAHLLFLVLSLFLRNDSNLLSIAIGNRLASVSVVESIMAIHLRISLLALSGRRFVLQGVVMVLHSLHLDGVGSEVAAASRAGIRDRALLPSRLVDFLLNSLKTLHFDPLDFLAHPEELDHLLGIYSCSDELGD